VQRCKSVDEANSLKYGEIDLLRFEYRMKKIIDIINSWLSEENSIVCLQEVNKKLLTKLIEIFGEDRLKNTTQKDSISFLVKGKKILKKKILKKKKNIV